MSKTEIYRCDICGDETTKARDWRLGGEVYTCVGFMHNGISRLKGDICPTCAERIEAAFDEAWEKAKEACR
ncbi:MAG: hypothetical protein IJH04_05520 [Eggerthellaceae bacterium]|nr:hypothetical protein [Eggerthellaceae bacterium]